MILANNYKVVLMTQRIYRAISEPLRENLSWNERWKGSDKGLIISWETGRRLRINEPELAERALKGELPVLGWKGGTKKATLQNEKYGPLLYLAQWQGLRGEDLDINISQEYELICSKTGMKVIYTNDVNKYLTS